MLFDKRRAYNCALFRSMSDPFNPVKWQNKDLYYPVAHLTGVNFSDITIGSILTIEMDGLSGAEHNLTLRCEVVDPKLVLCKPGVALGSKLSYIFSSNKTVHYSKISIF